MYCTTCGAVVPQGQFRCEFCGTRVQRAAPAAPPFGPGSMAMQPSAPPMAAAYGPLGEALGVCPRCAFTGVGAGYFSRGENVAKLVLITLLVWVGGPIYWFVRKDHKVCPACGLKWGPYGRYAGALPPGARAGGLVPQGGAAGVPMLPEEGEGRRWSLGAVAFWLFAAMMTVLGVTEAAPALFFALAAGVVGYGLQKRRDRRREKRREMLQAQLEQTMMRLASQHGGRLTVTEVASTMSWPMQRAERVLASLDDGFRVCSEVTDEGVIVYEFREIMHRPDRLPPAIGA